MLNWIVQYWLQAAMGALCAAFAAAFAYLRNKMKRQSAVEKGVKAILYDRLWQAHTHYMQKGWISVPDLRNIGYLYDAYRALDGNGTGTKLYGDLRQLPSSMPREEQI